MGSARNRILTLDIGASKLVLAEFSAGKTGVPELISYGVGKLGVEPDQEADPSAYIVSAIHDVMRSNNVKPAPLLMAVSGQAVFPRYVKLPPVTKDKVLQMVQYEAEQNVPFPIEEVVWDYQLISNDEDGSMNVMLAAVKTENIKKLTDCVLAAGLEPEIVDVATMALYNVVRYNYPDLEGCTMVLDIGARSSNLIFVEKSLIFSRSIPVAGNAVTQELMKEFELPFKDAEELKIAHAFVAFGGVSAGPEGEVADRVSKIVRNVITRLHAEVNRSINFYRGQQGGNPPNLVLLTGGSSVIPHMDTFFREKLKVDVEYMNPFSNISVGGGIPSDKIAAEMHLLGAAAGLALRRALKCPVELNLMPPDIVAAKVFRKRQPFFAIAAAGLILTVVCWMVFAFQIRTLKENQLDIVKKQIAERETMEKKLKEQTALKDKAAEKANNLTMTVDLRTQWIEMLNAVHNCMMDGMWLASAQPVVTGDEIANLEIRIKGFEDKLKPAPDGRPAFEVLRDRLSQSEYFRDTNVTSIVSASVKGNNAILDCTINIGLKRPIKFDRVFK